MDDLGSREIVGVWFDMLSDPDGWIEQAIFQQAIEILVNADESSWLPVKQPTAKEAAAIDWLVGVGFLRAKAVGWASASLLSQSCKGRFEIEFTGQRSVVAEELRDYLPEKLRGQPFTGDAKIQYVTLTPAGQHLLTLSTPKDVAEALKTAIESDCNDVRVIAWEDDWATGDEQECDPQASSRSPGPDEIKRTAYGLIAERNEKDQPRFSSRRELAKAVGCSHNAKAIKEVWEHHKGPRQNSRTAVPFHDGIADRDAELQRLADEQAADERADRASRRVRP